MFATLFYSDAFTADDVRNATRSLMAYSIGLLGFILIKVLAPGFYSRQDTATPVRIGVIAMVVNMGLNIALVFPLAHAGLALATTLSSSLNAFLLYRRLRREGAYRPPPGWDGLLLRAGLAAGLMGALLAWGTADLEVWLALGAWERVLRLVLWIGAGTLAYFALLLLLGIRLRHFRHVSEWA
jgi:putative peptidoglycan lipid II flippase